MHLLPFFIQLLGKGLLFLQAPHFQCFLLLHQPALFGIQLCVRLLHKLIVLALQLFFCIGRQHAFNIEF
jgi:hypothetical protein